MRASLAATALAGLTLAACSPATPPYLFPIEPQSVAVNQTLHVQVRVGGALGTGLRWRMDAPSVPDLRALLAPNPSGAELRWTPLASHVGEHPITIRVDGSAGSDSETLLVRVVPPPEGAPIFLRPGAGQTFDLSRDPCVVVPVEVKDDDSSDITIETADPVVEGSELASDGSKLATWRWCPTPEQVSVSSRYTLHLIATDEAHDPTPHTFAIVLRTGNRPDCPGQPPTVTITSPPNAARLATILDYPIDVTVHDDQGVRDAPLLYFTLDPPEDGEAPDLTAFEQILCEPVGADQYRAYIPNLGLPVGSQAEIWFLASATDNDDPAGALCDHVTDTPLRAIQVATPDEPDRVGYCDACSGDDQCADGGLCVIVPDGASFCGAPCADGCAEGLCRLVTSRGGVVDDQCVPDGLDCSGGTIDVCTDDTFEDNDSRAAAALVGFDVYTDLQVCGRDDDYYVLPVEGESRIDLIIDGFDAEAGDLDLFLLDPDGSALKMSAGEGSSEEVSVCVREAGDYVARVAGFDGSENRYDMLINAAPEQCCEDDDLEDDDEREDARTLHGPAIDGQICAGDDDWIAVYLNGSDRVTIEVTFDPAEGNIDLELYDPDGAIVASSLEAGGQEQIVHDSQATGDHAVRVFGRSGAEASYQLAVSTEGRSDCFSDEDCGEGQHCADGYVCEDSSCTGPQDCAEGSLCPDPGPDDAPSMCAPECEVNGDCGEGEACKGFAEGRACGRTGAGTNGAPCETFADCSGQRACLEVPAGYCAEIGCVTSFDCPQGSLCVPGDEGMNVCFKDCFGGADACRLAEGHRCENVVDTRGSARSVCLP